jgi:hypothetical protein
VSPEKEQYVFDEALIELVDRLVTYAKEHIVETDS